MKSYNNLVSNGKELADRKIKDMPYEGDRGDEKRMNVDRLEVLILNHKPQAVKKFGRNSLAVRYYQEGESSELVNDLYKHWFGINEACIIAHHLATINDEQDEVNYMIAINSLNTVRSYELKKLKGKRLRYIFIFFDSDEMKARTYVYQILKPLLLQNKTQPISLAIDYHNINFY